MRKSPSFWSDWPSNLRKNLQDRFRFRADKRRMEGGLRKIHFDPSDFIILKQRGA